MCFPGPPYPHPPFPPSPSAESDAAPPLQQTSFGSLIQRGVPGLVSPRPSLSYSAPRSSSRGPEGPALSPRVAALKALSTQPPSETLTSVVNGLLGEAITVVADAMRRKEEAVGARREFF